MSRIGKKPVAIPSGVKVAVANCAITVEGKLGKLTYDHRPEVTITVDEEAKNVVCDRNGNERADRAYHGLTRALVANMIRGVTEGYEKATRDPRRRLLRCYPRRHASASCWVCQRDPQEDP